MPPNLGLGLFGLSLSLLEKGRACPQSPCMTKETGDASRESREPPCRSSRALTPGARG